MSVEDGKIAPCGTHLRPIATSATTAAANVSASNSASALVGKISQGAVLTSPSSTSSLLAEEKKTVTCSVTDSVDGGQSQGSTAMDVQDDDVVVVLTQDMFSAQKKATSIGDAAIIAKTAVVTRENSAQNGATAHSSARSSPSVSVPVIYMSSNTMVDDSEGPPPRPPSIPRPTVPLHGHVAVAVQQQQQVQHLVVQPTAQASHSQGAQSVAPGMDAFRQNSAMIGLVSDPRLRRTASLQDYHSSPGHSDNGRLVSMGGGGSVPIHSASFGYAGSVAMDNTSSNGVHGSRIKIPIPLPMGATDKRDLIAAVNPFTPLSYLPAMVASGPQPFNPYTRHRYGSGQAGIGMGMGMGMMHGMQQHGLQGMMQGGVAGVPYAYEYEGAGEVHHRPVYDSVGFHTTHRAANGTLNGTVHGSAGNNNSEEFGVGGVNGVNGEQSDGGGYIMLPPSSTPGANTTFRLGKKGAITRN